MSDDEGVWDADLEDESDVGSSEGLEDSDDDDDGIDAGSEDDSDVGVCDDESERVARPESTCDDDDGVEARSVVHSEALLEEIRGGRRFARYRSCDLADLDCDAWSLPPAARPVRCWNCAGELCGPRVARCPVRHDIRTGCWDLFGYFHGWGCVARYCIDRPRADASKCLALVGALARHAGYRGNVVPAPPVWLLEHFGGTMTFDDYLRHVDCEIGELRGVFVRYPMVAVENVVCSRTGTREVDRHWSPSEFDRRRATCAELETSPFEAVMPPALFDEFEARRAADTDANAGGPAPVSDPDPDPMSVDPPSSPVPLPPPSPVPVPLPPPSPSSVPVPSPSPKPAASKPPRNRSRGPPAPRFSADSSGDGVVVTTPTKRIRMGVLVRRPASTLSSSSARGQ